MEMDYRISLWNYFHYNRPGTLERVIGEIRDAGYGVEIWPRWSDEGNLFDPIYRERLKLLIGDMPSSIHGGSPGSLEQHLLQIETAAETDCDVIVVHPGQIKVDNGNRDYEFAQQVVDLARDRGIVIALENGPLEVLQSAVARVEGLGICLDVGHIYSTPNTMTEFVDSLRHNIRHLHLQDTLGSTDHYVPGTGRIPRSDWGYLFRCLVEENFHGAAVLEIRPRNPLQHAEQTREFLKEVLPTGA